jgi:hypothetical protein
MKPPANLANDPASSSMIELESRLDRLLRNQVPDEQFVRSLRSTVEAWSQANWTAAESMGPSILASSELDHGLRLAQRPVFVCGLARSGTTLLRDLLDGHPQLVALPDETGFYGATARALADIRSDRHLSYLGCRWLEKLAARPPFWLLGPFASAASPYVAFARDYAGWWQVSERRNEARNNAWPLAAFALAYAQRLGGGTLPPDARIWVEKTPGHYRFLARIWQDFPAAKVIQIVRRPEAVLASVKISARRMPPHRSYRRRTVEHILRQMAVAYWVAADNHARLPDDRYCLVRYEDLTADPDMVMLRIARFLEIEPQPSLLLPTVAGRPAANNSSFGASRPDLNTLLDPIERALLELAVARSAAKLGYARSQALGSMKHRVVGELAQ